MTSARWIAGVDGCKSGWIVAFQRFDVPSEIRVRVEPCIDAVISAPEAPEVIAIDVPIGLPERSSRRGRTAEREVAPLLGRLGRSVFPVPSRAAVWAEPGPFASQGERIAAHRRAGDVALGTSDPQGRFSFQTFCILPKVREIDQFLRRNPALRNRVIEVHPEVAFWRMNGDAPLSLPKTTADGAKFRSGLLRASGIPATAVQARPPRGAKPDDLLDALAALVVARRWADGGARPFPNPPETDAHGLPIAIWA